ncbi:MAG: PD40 domain-containing protein [Anaerolineae bacterium]|nr:PD40 domain-containing protein [Anaerolineae bacterium]
MARKYRLGAIVMLSMGCALAAGVALVVASRSVPGVARLMHGDPAGRAATSEATSESLFTLELEIATLTHTPTPPPTARPTELSPSRSTPVPTQAAATQTVATRGPTAPPTTTPTATLTPMPTNTLAPTATPRPQWLAFETKRGELGDYEIYAITPTGTRLTNLTASWADDVAPVWSPDGRRIAFVSFRDTLTGKWGLSKGSIYIMAFDPVAGKAGEVVRVTDGEGGDGWPTWSPDGKRLAFHSDRGGNLDIWVVNVDGSGLTRLTESPADDRYPAWSPDGKKIAYTSNRSGNEDVWVMNVHQAPAGAEPTGGAADDDAVNLTKSPERDRYPMWSPDGSRLTFNTNRDGDYEVYVMNADGSQPQNISRSPKTTEGLADWSPDGYSLVIYSDRPGNKDVFVVSLKTGKWVNVTRDPASDEFCTWSR